jgi:hypothetical protein
MVSTEALGARPGGVCASLRGRWRDAGDQFPGRPHQTVEALAVAPVDALLELGADVPSSMSAGGGSVR